MKQMRRDADHIEYASLDAMENIIIEYVPAYHAFYSFMEWTIIHDIDAGFKNMIYILLYLWISDNFFHAFSTRFFLADIK